MFKIVTCTYKILLMFKKDEKDEKRNLLFSMQKIY